MKINIPYGVYQPLRIAVGITMLVLLLASGVNATKIINDNATGGDCKSFGTWNVKIRTCTMTKDLTEGIRINSNNLILNGNGRTIAAFKPMVLGVITGEAGVYLLGRTGVTIKNLNVINNYYFNGILVDNSNNNRLIDNNLSQNGDDLVLRNSSNNILSGNNINEGTRWGRTGISLYKSNNNRLINNNANSNRFPGACGISISSSTNNILSGNDITNNDEGLCFINAGGNTVSGNNVYSNIAFGIYFSSSSNNILSGNNINSNNGAGIYLGTASNNKIYNNIFNNTGNFYIWESNFNTWNTNRQSSTNIIGGSYLGGNFWANPGGTGFSQTCADANKDGICDTKYTLDSNNIDYLPLTSTSSIGITPQQQIQQITTDIQSLVTSGMLNKGQGNSLTINLESAMKNLNSRNTNAAINELNAFIKEVQAHIKARRLTQAQGQKLIDAANAVISGLKKMR